MRCAGVLLTDQFVQLDDAVCLARLAGRVSARYGNMIELDCRTSEGVGIFGYGPQYA